VSLDGADVGVLAGLGEGDPQYGLLPLLDQRRLLAGDPEVVLESALVGDRERRQTLRQRLLREREPELARLPGDDDNGTVGDGSAELGEDDTKGQPNLGDYGAFNDAAGEFEDIFNAVRDAAEEAESISGSRLREEVVIVHRATAAAHAERRKKNAKAAQRWKR